MTDGTATTEPKKTESKITVVGTKPSNGDSATPPPEKKEPAKKEPKKEPKKVEKQEYVGKGETRPVHPVPLSEIVVPKDSNPRKIFDREALQGLAASIVNFGVIEPIICVMRDGKPTLIAGERRYRAAKLAEQKTIPTMFTVDDPTKIYAIQLIENLQHEHLHPLEEAQAFKRLLGTTTTLPNEKEPVKLNVKGLAKMTGRTSGWVSQRLSMLELPEALQNAFLKNEISFSQMRELATIEDEKEQTRLLGKIRGSDETTRVSDLKNTIDKAKAKRRLAKKEGEEAEDDKKKRGRPAKEEPTTMPSIRQKLDTVLDNLKEAKFEVRKVAELRETMGMVYTRYDSAKSDDKKIFYKGAVAALEWMAGFREEL
jgi:ParB family chromosome partitioning protein